MSRTLIFLFIVLFVSINIYCETIKYSGIIAGKYPIIMELTFNNDGSVSGKFAYESTLRKLGAISNGAYLYVDTTCSSTRSMVIREANGKFAEDWYNINFSGNKQSFTTTVKNSKGNVFNATLKASGKNFTSVSNKSDILKTISRLSELNYNAAYKYVTTGNSFKFVKRFDYYYNGFLGNPDYYEGQYVQYSNGAISVYFCELKKDVQVWLNNSTAFKKFTSELKSNGYRCTDYGEGARGNSWDYTNGINNFSIWTGGGSFEGYNVSLQ